MSYVRLTNVAFGYEAPLFEGLSGRISEGWTGLVGENGAGKTTLLRLLAGELRPTAGSIQVSPGGSVVCCHQRVAGLLPQVQRFAADHSRQAGRWRGRLGLQLAQLARWSKLSAGERKRWQLAAALAGEPTVLLLDEPTNHLDGDGRRVLEQALRRFDGVGVLVSHDRALLDALTTRTARLHAGQLQLLRGRYSDARAQWESDAAQARSASQGLRRECRRLQRRSNQQREHARHAEQQRSVRRRSKGPKDSDARFVGKKNRAEGASRRLAQDASALASRLQRVQQQRAALRVEKPLGRELFADYARYPTRTLFRVAFESLHAGDRRLLGRASLTVQRDQKVWLQGANGAGKTTLLTEIARQNAAAFASCLYLPQTLQRRDEARLRSALLALGPEPRGRALSYVAALGTRPEAVLASSAWSPGETRKVALALGLAREVPGLLLDEPTNHLDLPSLERLGVLLREFPGAMLLVTRDAALGAETTNRVWEIRAGQLVDGSGPDPCC